MASFHLREQLKKREMKQIIIIKNFTRAVGVAHSFNLNTLEVETDES